VSGAFTFVPMALGSLGTGVLFGQFLLAAARNPDEYEKLYGTCLTAFALIETFSFLAIIACLVIAMLF
jgi:F0F1-type ATP synthase membrane subunit c/vacuolar-type H+-ATPase subunit K